MSEKLPFREVRADQPLTGNDFAAIRKAVADDIASRNRSHGFNFLYPAIASAVLAILGILAAAFIGSLPRPQPPDLVRTPAAITRWVPAPVVAAAPGPEANVAAVAPPHKSRRTHRPKPVAPLIETAEREPVVIHLQTSNPDIRILWIAR